MNILLEVNKTLLLKKTVEVNKIFQSIVETTKKEFGNRVNINCQLIIDNLIVLCQFSIVNCLRISPNSSSLYSSFFKYR